MNGDKLFTLLASIVTVTLVTTIVAHADGSKGVISSLSNGFIGSLRVAQGR